ncbi:MAG: DUF1080 domain-containing protein, partial [Rhodothermales bacterium]|nr:DUF1080 domain-containing protein [Rhodothermales bacterium]
MAPRSLFRLRSHPTCRAVGVGLLLLVGGGIGSGCATQQGQEGTAAYSSDESASMSDRNALTTAEAADGWTLLFDGADLSAWRAYAGGDVPAGWRVDDGAIHFDPTVEGGGGDIVTREEYGDFELALEWKLSPCGNSGIFYRGAEGMEYVWQTAPEMQVLDNACHP